MGGCRILFISSALLLSCALSSGQESSRVDTLAASVVTAQDNPASIHTGLVRLDRKMLSEAPAVLGSPDVIKVIQNLPGVSAGTELMSDCMSTEAMAVTTFSFLTVCRFIR